MLATRPQARATTEPQPWEAGLLRLLAEQSAAPFDQFARFIGCEPEQAARVAKHLAASGLTDYGRTLAYEPHWIWLTARGARFSGTDFPAGLPRVGAISRIRAVNEVRLQITARAPEARWISGRSVYREQGRRGHRPSAVVEVDDERHAIVVKPGAFFDPDREARRIETHVGRYDAVIYFAGPRSLGPLKNLQAAQRFSKLIVRPIPTPPKPGTKSAPESS